MTISQITTAFMALVADAAKHCTDREKVLPVIQGVVVCCIHHVATGEETPEQASGRWVELTEKNLLGVTRILSDLQILTLKSAFTELLRLVDEEEGENEELDTE